MHLSVLSPRRGVPGHMWGISLFRRIFGQNPHCGAPKLMFKSDQISPQVFHQFILKMSSQKPVVILYKYNEFLPPLKTELFQGFAKVLKAMLLQFQDGWCSSCLFCKWSMPFLQHSENLLTINIC